MLESSCNSPESQVLLKLCFWGGLRGDSASWSLDSPSRIADLVAGPRLDSTSPDMDSASRHCSAETLTVQFWIVFNALLGRHFQSLVD